MNKIIENYNPNENQTNQNNLIYLIDELNIKIEDQNKIIIELRDQIKELIIDNKKTNHIMNHMYLNFTRLKDKIIEKSERDMNRDIRLFHITKKPVPFFPIHTTLPGYFKYYS